MVHFRLPSVHQLESDSSHGYDGNVFVFGKVVAQLCNEYVETARGEIIGFGPESFENGFASDDFVPVLA